MNGSPESAAANEEIDLRIANPWFYPVLVGPGERFRRYATPLRERGIRTSVSTVRWDDLADEEVIDGIEIRRYAVDTRSRRKVQSFVNQLAGELEGGAARPDVLQERAKVRDADRDVEIAADQFNPQLDIELDVSAESVTPKR